MKTAEEFLVRDELFKTPLTEEEKHYYIDRIITYDDYIKGMIEFAKYHVQKALQSAYDYHTIEKYKKEEMYDYPDIENFRANKKSILNAYPLDLIK